MSWVVEPVTVVPATGHESWRQLIQLAVELGSDSGYMVPGEHCRFGPAAFSRHVHRYKDVIRYTTSTGLLLLDFVLGNSV